MWNRCKSFQWNIFLPTVIFSSWALRDFSKSSCFFRRASTLSRESPRSSFRRKAFEEKRLRHFIPLSLSERYDPNISHELIFLLPLACSSSCRPALCPCKRAAGPCTAHTAVCAAPTAPEVTPSLQTGCPAEHKSIRGQYDVHFRIVTISLQLV